MITESLICHPNQAQRGDLVHCQISTKRVRESEERQSRSNCGREALSAYQEAYPCVQQGFQAKRSAMRGIREDESDGWRVIHVT